ncbi:unnamed protein product [Gordionus sp. m RMFG-2023]
MVDKIFLYSVFFLCRSNPTSANHYVLPDELRIERDRLPFTQWTPFQNLIDPAILYDFNGNRLTEGQLRKKLNPSYNTNFQRIRSRAGPSSKFEEPPPPVLYGPKFESPSSQTHPGYNYGSQHGYGLGLKPNRQVPSVYAPRIAGNPIRYYQSPAAERNIPASPFSYFKEDQEHNHNDNNDNDDKETKKYNLYDNDTQRRYFKDMAEEDEGENFSSNERPFYDKRNRMKNWKRMIKDELNDEAGEAQQGIDSRDDIDYPLVTILGRRSNRK